MKFFSSAWAWIKKVPLGAILKPFWKAGAKIALNEMGARLKTRLVTLIDDDSDASVKAINSAFDGLQEQAIRALNFVKFIPQATREKIAAQVQQVGDRVQGEAVEALKKGGPAALVAALDGLEKRLEEIVDRA